MPTVTSWVTSWIEFRASKKHLSPSTISGYKRILKLHIAPTIGALQLSELAPEHIAFCLSGPIRNNHSRTAELTYVLLRAALGCAVEKRILPSNPVFKEDRPFHVSAFTSWWNAEQVRRFLAANAEDPFLAAWLLALTCGLRRGELLGLQWQDVDFDRKLLYIRRQRIHVDGVTYERPPKSRAGIRDIPLPEAVVPALLACQRQQTRVKASKYLLARRDGQPISATTLAKRHAAAIRLAGVPYIPLHGMRHSMASLAAAAGVSIKIMQGILGHATFSVTADIYTHVDDSAKRLAISAISGLVFAI